MVIEKKYYDIAQHELEEMQSQNHTPYRIFQPKMSTDMTQAAENSTVYSAGEL